MVLDRGVRMKIEDYTKYYIQGSDHYLIPKDVFMELFNEMINWKEETKKQKEVIDNIKYYLEENGNQMSEDATYELMNFIKRCQNE